MTVSVIIPSYQGAEKIIQSVKALENQTFKDFELVIVIDGSTDDTHKRLTSIEFNIPSLNIIEQANRGRSGARNAGAKKATGDLLIFYDDDIIPDKRSVEKHYIFHQQLNNTILTGDTPQLLSERPKDFTSYRAYLSKRWVKCFDEKPVSLTRSNLFLSAANCSLKKDTFIQLQGFSESMKDAEDKELGIRAFKQNVSLYFDKYNIGFHNETITCASYIKRLRQYAIANDEVSRRHPDYSLAKENNIGVRRKIYWVLANLGLVGIIDGFNFLILLPRGIRYKIYDAVTFSLSEVYPQTKI